MQISALCICILFFLKKIDILCHERHNCISILVPDCDINVLLPKQNIKQADL